MAASNLGAGWRAAAAGCALALAAPAAMAESASTIAIDQNTVQSLRRSLAESSGASSSGLGVQVSALPQEPNTTAVAQVRVVATEAGAQQQSAMGEALLVSTAPEVAPAETCNGYIFEDGSVIRASDACPSPSAAIERAVDWKWNGALVVARMNFAAEAIAVSDDGAVWFLDATGAQKDKPVKKLTATGITSCGGAAGLRIAAGVGGKAYVVNAAGQVWQGSCNAGSWSRMGAEATASDVAVGGSNAVWILAKGVPAKWDAAAGTWTHLSGEGERLGVTVLGDPWVVNKSGAIWRYDGASWTAVTGWASGIDVDVDGRVYVVGSGGQIYRSVTTESRPTASRRVEWIPVPGVTGSSVAVAPDGHFYAIAPGTKTVIRSRFTSH